MLKSGATLKAVGSGTFNVRLDTLKDYLDMDCIQATENKLGKITKLEVDFGLFVKRLGEGTFGVKLAQMSF